MQTVNFPCSYCGNLMAVGMDLLGRHVRCPHCRQVVLAPSAAPTAVGTTTAPNIQPAPQPPVKPDPGPIPQFHLPNNHEPESIFTEHVDEDLFGGTRQPRPEIPSAPQLPLPPQQPQYQPAPQHRAPQTHFATYPPEVVTPPVPPAPFQDFVPAAPSPEPYPQHYEPAPPVEAFPNFSTAPAYTPPAPEQPAPTQPQPEKPAGAPQRLDAAPAKGPTLLVTILVPYAILATGVIIYLIVQLNKVKSVSPLEMIPDIYGEYEKPDRKGAMARPLNMPRGSTPLPEHLTVALGKTVRVGDIEVTPEKVERKKLRIFTVPKGATAPAEPKTSNGDALVLTLRVKNHSDDISIYPTDPAFNRYFDPATRTKGRSADPPFHYTFLEVGRTTFYGSAIEYPWKEGVQREYVDGQQDDAKPLKPGEERRYVICTHTYPRDNELVNTVQRYKDADPLLWRVQLRRGLVPFKGREIGVSAVIGVKFQPGDIKKG
jgi:hypothetical protein